MTSLWLDREPAPAHPRIEPGLRFDHVVVGGGLTGVTTALLLARAGVSVALIEARTLGACATGNTTAKLSLLQGTQLSTIAAKHSTEKVRAYVDANREGQQWLLRFCAERGIPTQSADAFTYAQSAEGTAKVRAEYDACRNAGLDVAWVDRLELPFPAYGAVRLDDQAQFDPMDVLLGLAEQAQQEGAVIFENTRVHNVRSEAETRVVETDHGDVRASGVVLATGTPILDRGGFFARLVPNRSYSLAFRVPEPVPHGMYLSADSPTRSLRYAPGPTGDLLLVGGNGHVVGRASSTRALVDDLVEWTQRYFPGAVLTHRWSAQDYHPIDGLPYVGPLLPGANRILVATGYAKWGMSNAVAAALAVSARVFDGHMKWAKVFDTWHPGEFTGVPTAAKANGEVAMQLAKGWLSTGLRRGTHRPAEGSGRVERRGVRPVASCTVDGRTTSVSAICPHLYGIVDWNDVEQTWDCPLHGSRFAPDGRVLEGPATRPLTPKPQTQEGNTS